MMVNQESPVFERDPAAAWHPYKQVTVCYLYISTCVHVVCPAGLEETYISDIMACVIHFKLIGNRLWLSFWSY